jgi:hypothetical protein
VLTALSNAGSPGITINGPVTAAPGQNVTLSTDGTIGGTGTVSGNAVTINSGSGIGSIAGNVVTPLRLNVDVLELQNTSGDVVIENAKTVTLQNHFSNSAPGKELRLTTSNGSIIANAVVQSSNGRIALIANETGAGNNGNITVNGGIVSNGGEVILHAADAITVNGTVSTGGGDVRMIAGTGPGLFNFNDIFTAPNPPLATETADDNGTIVLNAPILTGTGDTVLVASADGTGPLAITEGIAQTFSGRIVTQRLTAVTLRGAGGFNQGGAGIHLNRADTSNNNEAPLGINLFACSYVGCPDGVAPFNTAPFIVNLGAPPPAFFYGDGPIFYTD